MKKKNKILAVIICVIMSFILALECVELIHNVKERQSYDLWSYNHLKVSSIAIENEAQIEGIGAFSVSADKQVTFAPGNLQYHLGDKKWQLAANQSDIVGQLDSTNGVHSKYLGWIDLFDWKTATLPSATWRLLSKDEWVYVVSRRENAEALFALGIVNNEAGMILLPDNWVQPEGVNFVPSMTKGLYRVEGTNGFFRNTTSKSYFDNIYNADQWSLMQQAGAVFLPAGGYRSQQLLQDLGFVGYYWSSTSCRESDAEHLMFHWSRVNSSNFNSASFGYSVRMVKDL